MATATIMLTNIAECRDATKQSDARHAIRGLQEAEGLPVTGLVDPNVLRALKLPIPRVTLRSSQAFKANWLSDLPAPDLIELAAWLQATNRVVEAEPLIRRIFRFSLSSAAGTGNQHPHFRVGLENYIVLLKEMGINEDEVVAIVL